MITERQIERSTPIQDTFFMRKLRVEALKNSFAIYNDSGQRIATINNFFMRQKEIAELFAAAPELPKALVDVMKIADPDGEATDIWAVTARAAIAKARAA
jgi:hypothetical protein